MSPGYDTCQEMYEGGLIVLFISWSRTALGLIRLSLSLLLKKSDRSMKIITANV